MSWRRSISPMEEERRVAMDSRVRVRECGKTGWRAEQRENVAGCETWGKSIHSSVGKESACNAGDPGSIPGLGRSAGEGISYPLQYSWASLMAQLGRIRLQCRRPGFDPWVGKIPWRRKRLHTPVFWLGEFHGLYSPWGFKELDTTERLPLFRECGKEAWRVLRCGSPWRQGIQWRPLFLCNTPIGSAFPFCLDASWHWFMPRRGLPQENREPCLVFSFPKTVQIRNQACWACGSQDLFFHLGFVMHGIVTLPPPQLPPKSMPTWNPWMWLYLEVGSSQV